MPTDPDFGDIAVITGVARTVKLTLLLVAPDKVTTTFPLVAPMGTGTTTLVVVQSDGAEGVPLNVAVAVPRVGPKPVPVMVTGLPTPAELGDMLVIVGTTVKLTPLLLSPDTVTTTLPVVAVAGTGTTMLVALQLVGIAVAPLKVTVLVP